MRRSSKWKFSHPALRGDDEEEEQDEEASILGIRWNTKTDRLSVAIDEEKFIERAQTPRQIVKQQASLYDPLGITAPFIFLGRKLTQKSMKPGWGWDLRLDDKLEREFNQWTSTIPLLKELLIERAWDDEEKRRATFSSTRQRAASDASFIEE